MTLSRLAAAEAARGDGVLRFADYRGMDEAVTETADEALAGLDPAARGQLPDLIAGLVRDVAADPVTGAPTPVIGALDRAAFEAGRPERTRAGRSLRRQAPADRRRRRGEPARAPDPRGAAAHLAGGGGDHRRGRAVSSACAMRWSRSRANGPRRRRATRRAISTFRPPLLDGAERYVERFGDEVSQATRDFVAAASAAAAARRDRERQEQQRRPADAEAIAAANKRIARRTGVGLVAALALVGLAGWQWRWRRSPSARRKPSATAPERSLTLATPTANGLIFDIAQKFRNVAGVPTPLIKDVLDQARNLQASCWTRASPRPR